MQKTALTICMLIMALWQAPAQDAYIEYKITADQPGVSGSTKLYSHNGSIRSEMAMTNPQISGGLSHIGLILRDSANKTFVLDTKNKTYTVIDMAAIMAREDTTQYDLTIVGNEKIDGYNTTHVKVNRKNLQMGENVWISTEVPNYKQYMGVSSQYNRDGLYKALIAQGLVGFPVRTTMTQRGIKMSVDLVKTETRKNDPSLFSLAGYTKAQTRNRGSDTQDMMKKMQNMTPEERQQFIDQMRKNQQEGQPH
jgi:hypothetical protein